MDDDKAIVCETTVGHVMVDVSSMGRYASVNINRFRWVVKGDVGESELDKVIGSLEKQGMSNIHDDRSLVNLMNAPNQLTIEAVDMAVAGTRTLAVLTVKGRDQLLATLKEVAAREPIDYAAMRKEHQQWLADKKESERKSMNWIKYLFGLD